MIYRHNGLVQLQHVKDNDYELKLCSVMCLADTNLTDQKCDDKVAVCDDCKKFIIEPILVHHNNSCNETMTVLTSSNSTISNPAITPTLCIVTSTTVVSIITTVTKEVTHPSVAATPPVNRNTAKTLQISQTVLGAMVGIFGILLAIVSTGWVCTCWVMQKRRREMNTNATNIR